MKRSIILLIVFFINSVHAQDATFAWAKSFGSTEEDVGRKMIRNSCGDLYCAGFFHGTTDMDPGAGVSNATSNGGRDIFISKFDALGNFLWSKCIGGNLDEIVGTFVTDSDNSIYMTGGFGGTVDFDPGPSVSNLSSGVSQAVFLLKLDSAGNFLWVKKLAEQGTVGSYSTLKIAASGNIYASATFNGTVDFDPGPGIFNLTSAGTAWDDIFISKFDSDGGFIWAKQFTGLFLKNSTAITIDSQESLFICGLFNGTVDFDPGPGIYNLSVSIPATFIVKLNVDGNFIWAKQIAGNNVAQPWAMVMDAAENIYLTGLFYGHIDFDPGPGFFFLDSYGGDFSSFLLKLSHDGDLIWAQRFGGQPTARGACVGADIVFDADENIYLTGSFVWTVDFSPLVTLTCVFSDLYVLKLAKDGNFVYVKQMGGTDSQSSGRSIFLDQANNIYVTGNLYAGTVDYDPGPGVYNLTSNGSNDVFILKLSQCDQPTSATISKTICSDSYTLDCKTYTTTGVYSQVLINTAGCDSIVTLDLKFGKTPEPKLGPDKEQCIDSTNFFLLQTQDSYSGYEWSTGLTTPTISVQNIGEYWVKVKDAAGCEGSDTIKIVPKQCVIDLFIPSAFSPNNDHLNDVLKPGVFGTLNSFKMEIFNRFGEVIFRSTDPNKGWDGKYKGSPVPVGVYVWQCSYQFQNKGQEYQKGTVTVIR